MNTLWKDRKRILFFGLPFSFTKYTLLDNKLLVDTGLFTSNQDEIRLYRILDITLRRTLFQKIFGLGSIYCDTADVSSPKLVIENIKDPIAIKELLSEAVERERIQKRVSSREYMDRDEDDLDDTYN